MNKTKKQEIAYEVIKTLYESFEVSKSLKTNLPETPFHEAFLNAFQDKFDGQVSDIPLFISLSSWLHGLNTTLGQTFFENVANILCDGEKREYTSKKLGNLQISAQQKNNIGDRMTELSNSSIMPNLELENERIFLNDQTDMVNAMDFSADVFIEDNNSVTAIEIKSVKPNSGEMRGEKQKILEGKAALHQLFPNKDVRFLIGFPFDPTSNEPTAYDKTRFLSSIINMTKYFDPNETMVASEFWDFLSGGSDTMENILEIINTISTPEFLEKFQFINDSNNRENERYLEILEEWYLFSELELTKNDLMIKEAIREDRALQRIYNQKIFKKGEYNQERMMKLKALI